MDIRIGNDICIQIPISEFGDIDSRDIVNVGCTFVNKHGERPRNYKSHPVFHHSTQYTIRSCGYPSYYAYPCNTHVCCKDDNPHCGFVVCGKKHFPNTFRSFCTIEGGFINAFFPANHLHELGTYDCIFDIAVKQEGWDFDDLHTHSAKYEDVFTLSKSGMQAGSIVLNPTSKYDYDTYMTTISEEDLSKYEDDYSKLILMSDGFKLEDLPNNIKKICIGKNDKKIVIFSKYPNITISKDGYVFPMVIEQVGDYYLYISKLIYSNVSYNIEFSKSENSGDIITYGDWIKKETGVELDVSVSPIHIGAAERDVKCTVKKSFTSYEERDVLINGLKYDVLIRNEKFITDYPVTGMVNAESSTGHTYEGLLSNDGSFIIKIGENPYYDERGVKIYVTVNGITGVGMIDQDGHGKVDYVYYGSAINVEDIAVGDVTQMLLHDSSLTKIEISTTLNDKKKIHYCILPKGYSVTSVCDKDGDDITNKIIYKSINYQPINSTERYYIQSSTYISNKTIFTITKD